MGRRGFIAALALAPASALAGKSKADPSKVFGKIQLVSSFADYKVQVVDSFPDLNSDQAFSSPWIFAAAEQRQAPRKITTPVM